ncbi:MAG: GntR family transcriptional repressor for pyruvate dehydrogenase complex [Clostridium sp.]|jgi:GntR family transcriptional repressor for pyruvate dehydrogenase complex
MFETIENKHISQVIIEQIQDMIINGKLKLGDKLPPEREFTQSFGVSRPALREALKALEVIGLIERKHGQGNFISNNIENSFYKPLCLAFKLNNGSVDDILNLRDMVETFTVKEAAEKASAQDINKLYKIYTNMVEEKEDKNKSTYDKQLHYEIAKISDNKLMIYLLQSISYLMDAFIDKAVDISLYKEKSINEIYSEHLKIIKAIEHHDSIEAETAIKNHFGKINIKLLKEIQ